jgi:hypothetical protein
LTASDDIVGMKDGFEVVHGSNQGQPSNSHGIRSMVSSRRIAPVEEID